MPRQSVANQSRFEKFLKMIVSPFTTTETPVAKEKGFVAQVDDPRFVFIQEKLKVEMDRLSTLTDIRVMLDEAPYIDGVCNKFILWATVDRPKVIFQGGTEKRATKIVNEMLERIEYFSRRPDFLYHGLFLEAFLNKKVSLTEGISAPNSPIDSVLSEYRRGMSLGKIEEILGPLPPETMFRNSDKQDKFEKPGQAFYQVPEDYNNPSNMMHKQNCEWFHQMFMLHPRWNHRRQKSHRYSRPALKPVRKAYNRTEMSATDAVVQRHLAASRLLVIYLKKNVEASDAPGCTQDELTRFMEDFVMRYPTGFNKPGTVYVTSGDHQVDSVGDLNLTLSKPADIFMHFDFMSVGLMLHPVLAGFTGGEGGRITGPLLEQLKKNLEVDVKAVNDWEDREILLPLIYFELFLNGIFDTEVIVTHDRPSFEAKDVRRKTMMSEVASKIRSRKNYYEEEIKPETGEEWETYSKQIEDEDEKFGTAEPTQNINKGISGSNKDSATTEIDSEE